MTDRIADLEHALAIARSKCEAMRDKHPERWDAELANLDRLEADIAQWKEAG